LSEEAIAPKQPGKSPVKVFILAGQSNMEGQAVADLDGKDYNGGKGTLNALLADPSKASVYKHLKNNKGEWAIRENVWVGYQPEGDKLKAGPLTLGFTPYEGHHHFGPELQFGHLLGDHLHNHDASRQEPSTAHYAKARPRANRRARRTSLLRPAQLVGLAPPQPRQRPRQGLPSGNQHRDFSLPPAPRCLRPTHSLRQKLSTARTRRKRRHCARLRIRT
jgi:hypothetical protein